MTVPKYRFFLWLVMKKRLQTTEKMYRIGVSENSNCLICDQDDETEDHLIFQCCFSQEVWRRIKVWLQIDSQISTAAGIVQWIADCGKTKEHKEILAAAIGVVIYHIWWVRNQVLWHQKVIHIDRVVHNIQKNVITRVYSSGPRKLSRKTSDWLRSLSMQVCN